MRKSFAALFLIVAVLVFTATAVPLSDAQQHGEPSDDGVDGIPEAGVSNNTDAFDGEQPTPAETFSPDAVYVEDDGDAVLVYELRDGDSNTSVSYGADTSSGLVHFLAEGAAENSPLAGDFSVVAEPTSWVLDGSFETDEIESVEEMEMGVSWVTDTTDSEVDAELTSEFSTGAASMVSSASTEGEIVTERDRVTLSGSAGYRTALDGSSTREVLRFDLSGTDDEYTVEARERRLLEERRGFEEGTVAELSDVPDARVPDENVSDVPEPRTTSLASIPRRLGHA